jgi:hypothetical protein
MFNLIELHMILWQPKKCVEAFYMQGAVLADIQGDS